jgi:hypothetical protein
MQYDERKRSSARKIITNRANARASTGPKTPCGKASSSKNANRHGLSVPIAFIVVYSAEVENLTRQIVGADASTQMRELARRVAEAQVDLRRVRRARHRILAQDIGGPDDLIIRNAPKCRKEPETEQAFERLRRRNLRYIRDVLVQIERGTEPELEGPQQLAFILSDMARELAALDRYERRALSRRKFAIHAFDIARRQAIEGNDSEPP